MTYTREQVEKAISEGIWTRVMAIRSSEIEPRDANAAILAMTSAGEEIFHRLDQIQPIDIEPAPAPKENADEKFCLFNPPPFNPLINPDYAVCLRCKMYRCNHRRSGDLMVCTRPF